MTPQKVKEIFNGVIEEKSNNELRSKIAQYERKVVEVLANYSDEKDNTRFPMIEQEVINEFRCSIEYYKDEAEKTGKIELSEEMIAQMKTNCFKATTLEAVKGLKNFAINYPEIIDENNYHRLNRRYYPNDALEELVYFVDHLEQECVNCKNIDDFADMFLNKLNKFCQDIEIIEICKIADKKAQRRKL